ncbi:hypothetical protein V5O48_002218 [Marasmius crinis-equi]|uniref:Uncharacterized protein n=1 Tax=Marasmius crinis-equi TaxID=585013 RepID=A0ABR3FWA3_9AGAR
MAPTISSAISDFITALTSMASGIINSILAVLSAIMSLGKDIAQTAVHFVMSVVKLGVDLCQGMVGFVAANFFVLAILGGAYYFYTQNQNQGRRKLKSR